jgi:hypothetical protein
VLLVRLLESIVLLGGLAQQARQRWDVTPSFSGQPQ